MPEISIIVPVYKAEAYLHSCIDSILGQTFTDFELYLVNDGSPDRCGAICEEYAAKDSRVRVIHQENRGQAAARNRALERAEGEWICFVDSDDLIHPQMVKRLYDAAKDHDSGVSMCAMLEAPKLPDDFYDEPADACQVLEMDEKTLAELLDRGEYPAWVACAKLIKKELVMKHLFCEGRVYEDNEAVCHWVCAGRKLVRLEAAMYFYRTNPDSTTQQVFSRKKLDYLWALEQLIRFYDGLGYASVKSWFVHQYACELSGCWVRVSYQLKDRKLAKSLRRHSKAFARELKLRFSLEDKERMLDAMHPKLVRFYWPVKGAVCTVRQGGIVGMLKKIINRRKGQ